MQEMLGEHLILELYGCDERTLNDLPTIEATLLKAARKAGMTIIDQRFHQFSPQGVSGVVVVAESHLSIHTWPEKGYAAMDLFTCNLELAMDECLQLIRMAFAPLEMDVKRIPRGVGLAARV